MPHILFIFASAASAGYRVAGIPAAARAAHAVAALQPDDGLHGCTIAAGPDWQPDEAVRAECARLAPRLRLRFGDAPARTADLLVVRGEAFVAAVARRTGDSAREAVLPALFDACLRDRLVPQPPAREAAAIADLRRANRAILAATGKRGDGIVSRYVNRPISRAISDRLLRVPGIRPAHASLGTALLGIAIAFALFLGNDFGLVAGALLFQAASIFDGVDGEMARATYRTSDHGATLDSIIDACTNLAFVTGVTVNVGLAGDVTGATAGAVALIALAFGLLLIGRHADASGEPMNFDVIKRHFRRRERRSLLMEGLIHLTMRDFFAAASAILIVAGVTHWLLVAFATIALGWLAVTVTVLIRVPAGNAGDTAFDTRGIVGR